MRSDNVTIILATEASSATVSDSAIIHGRKRGGEEGERRGILVELERSTSEGTQKGKGGQGTREKEEYRRHSQVCVDDGRLGSGVYEEEERCSRAGHSEGMARRRGTVGSFEVGRYRV